MSDFIPPTKEELKQHYNIDNDHFDILVKDELPEPSMLQKLGQWLEPVFWCHGLPTYLLKNNYGRLIAILFLHQWGPTAVDRISDSFAMVQSAYNILHTPDMIESQKYKYAIVTTFPITLQQHQNIAATGEFPSGTGLYPYPTDI